MKRLSMVLAGSTLAISANAVTWLDLTKIESGSVFSIDTDSIENSDIQIIDEPTANNILVSIRTTYPLIKNDNNRNSTHYSEQQLLISCKDASYYKRAYVNYGKEDKVLKSWQTEKPILTTKDFKLTTPKTIGRLIVEQSCKNSGQAKKLYSN